MITGSLDLPENKPREGFSWQLNGAGFWFQMDRAKNAARAKARRTALVAKHGPAYLQAEAERHRRYRAECAAMTERAP